MLSNNNKTTFNLSFSILENFTFRNTQTHLKYTEEMFKKGANFKLQTKHFLQNSFFNHLARFGRRAFFISVFTFKRKKKLKLKVEKKIFFDTFDRLSEKVQMRFTLPHLQGVTGSVCAVRWA
jgi:hypothetical protein